MIKRTIVCLVLSLIAKPALAASVISVNCEITNSGNTDVFVLLDPAPTSSAIVSINGTEQAGTHSLNGPEISVQEGLFWVLQQRGWYHTGTMTWTHSLP